MSKDESQVAFEDRFSAYYNGAAFAVDDNGEYTYFITRYLWEGWQASEQRIKDKLLSEEMVDRVAKSLWEQHKNDMGPQWYCETETWRGVSTTIQLGWKEAAQAALQAIVEGLFGVGSESERGEQ